MAGGLEEKDEVWIDIYIGTYGLNSTHQCVLSIQSVSYLYWEV